jgi:hypothetical protein
MFVATSHRNEMRVVPTFWVDCYVSWIFYGIGEDNTVRPVQLIRMLSPQITPERHEYSRCRYTEDYHETDANLKFRHLSLDYTG